MGQKDFVREVNYFSIYHLPITQHTHTQKEQN